MIVRQKFPLNDHDSTEIVAEYLDGRVSFYKTYELSSHPYLATYSGWLPLDVLTKVVEYGKSLPNS